MGELREIKDKKGDVKGYCLNLYGYHLTPFLKYAAETVKAEPAYVRLEGGRIVVKAGTVKAEVVFKFLRLHKADYLVAADITQSLALYKPLRALGVRAEIRPGASKWTARRCGPSSL